ncbi:hypothetical protein PSE_3943 [Pseudovibrio sp. FO-BEG1]|uniref:Secreted protein n=1 Tax=Pseudovibrio denitrificans TaxID=258256 RepID=A0A1I6ZUK6_9HYPH|nr:MULTISPECIES: hypothetical protein [Pseudovibrio]AEV38447.1 hypothetical protein PSE_3943 [Pseudovibrio sp. FO-BEG1]SFT66361.1 hypothetical protein SAMN05444141_102619 [Pseudovibrio denitrificans]
MRIFWCLGLLLAGTFMVASESYAQGSDTQVTPPMTQYCNRGTALYADGSSAGGPMPMIKCGQNTLVYQRTNMSFPLSVVANGKLSVNNANGACQSAKAAGADAIVSNIQSLCNTTLWPNSCSQCN